MFARDELYSAGKLLMDKYTAPILCILVLEPKGLMVSTSSK